MAKTSFKGTPFTWAKARDLVHFIDTYIPAQQKFFGGSYCRHRPVVGDIDLAILPNGDTELGLFGFIQINAVATLVDGKKQKRFVIEHDGFQFQLDIWFADLVGQWGPLCMFVAGNGQLNIVQRAKAARVGYLLSQYGVYKNGQSVGDFPEERNVYDFFGWPWLPYAARELAKPQY